MSYLQSTTIRENALQNVPFQHLTVQETVLQNVYHMCNNESQLKFEHQFVISRYFSTFIHSFYLQDSFRIQTPQHLYKKHIVKSVADAVTLAENRQRYCQTTTVFLDPLDFICYPHLGIIVSVNKSEVYQVRPHLQGTKKVISRGEHFVLFEVFDNDKCHFNLSRFLNVQNITKC